ncbi:MAG: radical SAM protein [Planctomycetaceae bacterium]|nr:radical SAM protein [Planctomycetaceae bacterium]
MHYTGTIIRPPHEAKNVLLQVTVGCSYNCCTFCNIYDTPFRVSPMQEIEADLAEVRQHLPNCPRIFLLNGDAFVLSAAKLREIALKIREYLPNCRIISAYAGIGNIKGKTVEELQDLRSLGITKLTIGVESGDDEVLLKVRKGYTADDIVRECNKLDEAGMEYSIIYLAALAGAGKGEQNARRSAEVFNRIHPTHIGVTSLTLLPGSELHDDAAAGRFIESGELERARELRELVSGLNISTFFAANHVSNAVVVKGHLPEAKDDMVRAFTEFIDNYDEDALRRRRRNLRSL